MLFLRIKKKLTNKLKINKIVILDFFYKAF